MTAGQLRERLTFQSPSPQDDGMGNYVEGWTTEFTCWARLQPRVGGETVLAARLQGRAVYLITVREFSDTRRIQPEWQAVDARDATRVFQIKSPSRNVDEKGAYLEIDAEFGVAA